MRGIRWLTLKVKSFDKGIQFLNMVSEHYSMSSTDPLCASSWAYAFNHIVVSFGRNDHTRGHAVPQWKNACLVYRWNVGEKELHS